MCFSYLEQQSDQAKRSSWGSAGRRRGRAAHGTCIVPTGQLFPQDVGHLVRRGLHRPLIEGGQPNDLV